jgi:hypothetical protein
MEDEIVLDLGEYGSILVEPVGRVIEEEGGLVQAGVGDEVKRVWAEGKDLLKKPLSGLANAFVAALPDIDMEADYQLDEFSVEFDLGIAVEVGTGTVAVAKVSPSGTFKCTYTWKRLQEPLGKSAET